MEAVRDYELKAFFTYVIDVEDIILAKLLAFQETESDKHLRDARSVLVTQWGKLDLEAIRRGARAAGVSNQLEEIVEAARWEVER